MHMRAYFSYGILSHNLYATTAMNCSTMFVYNNENDCSFFVCNSWSYSFIEEIMHMRAYFSYGMLTQNHPMFV